jgi:hypothetical protein
MYQIIIILAILIMVSACAIEKTSPGGRRTVYSIYTDPNEAKEKHQHKVCDPPDENHYQRCTFDNGQVFYNKVEVPEP